MANVHPIVHIDIPMKDEGTTTAFYADVFGWSINNQMPGYPMFQAEGGPGGGFATHNEGNPVPLIYLNSKDINATLREIESHGGKMLAPRTEIEGGHGAFAVFTDPNGTQLALYEAPSGGE
jgi:predicted enzyme related to lactoylglutathione lyase